jgi:hypothetical protein
MFKFLLIVFFISYVIYKVGGFLFKILFIGAANAQQQKRQQYATPKRKAPRSNLHIDHVPSKGDKGYSGGDYVDYEEVKGK